ncbi:endonuclease [Sinorhizobium meliloti]|uniref:endonuclease n=1 Tax=Rhizobium meliloti TaxID=382 RepID=UPI000FDCA2BE|nr:endonuclease [Sinorhizobium meliloti]RVH21459.1 endonuclease [Sinorhizobium meliloti]RVH21520.1 endonuclease [Sinorhizobium meliloti]
MTSAEIFLPWPDRDLSPNARVHWAALHRAKHRAKTEAFWLTKEAGIGKIEADSLSVRYVIFPPDRRVRDKDNVIGSLKSAQDGIAEAIGIDDSKWTTSYRMAGAIEKGGMIKVELDWSGA